MERLRAFSCGFDTCHFALTDDEGLYSPATVVILLSLISNYPKSADVSVELVGHSNNGLKVPVLGDMG